VPYFEYQKAEKSSSTASQFNSQMAASSSPSMNRFDAFWHDGMLNPTWVGVCSTLVLNWASWTCSRSNQGTLTASETWSRSSSEDPSLPSSPGTMQRLLSSLNSSLFTLQVLFMTLSRYHFPFSCFSLLYEKAWLSWDIYRENNDLVDKGYIWLWVCSK